MTKKTFSFLTLLALVVFINMGTTSTVFAAVGGAPVMISTTLGEDTSTSANVRYQTTATTSYVEYTVDADIDFRNGIKIPGNCEEFKYENWNYPARNACYVNLTQLEPDMVYRYRVVTTDQESNIYTFKTANNTNEFRFALISDPQSKNPEEFQVLNSLTNKITTDYPDIAFFISGGDQVDLGDAPSQFENFFDAFPSLRKYPLFTIPGNHETMHYIPGPGEELGQWGKGTWVPNINEARAYNAHFYNPQNGPELVKNSSYYYVYNNALFVMLNTEVSGANLTSQKAWLENVLANNQSQYIIVTMHRGVYGNYYFDNATIENIRNNYVPIFDKYNVDIVFSGHDHTYARTEPMYNFTKSTDPMKGTVYMIAGSTGPKLTYTSSTNPKANEIFSIRRDRIGIYSIISIDNQKLTIKVMDASGNNIDNYTIPTRRKAVNQPVYNVNFIEDNNKKGGLLKWSLGSAIGVNKVTIEDNKGTEIATLNPLINEYKFTNLELGKTYNYRLKVHYKDQNIDIQPFTIKVNGIITLEANKLTNNEAKINFQAVENVDYYEIWLNNKLVDKVSKYANSYYLINLKAYTDNQVEIKAYSKDKNLLLVDGLTFKTKA